MSWGLFHIHITIWQHGSCIHLAMATKPPLMSKQCHLINSVYKLIIVLWLWSDPVYTCNTYVYTLIIQQIAANGLRHVWGSVHPTDRYILVIFTTTLIRTLYVTLPVEQGYVLPSNKLLLRSEELLVKTWTLLL